MESNKYKVLLAMQITTLLLVVILLFANLGERSNKSGPASVGGTPITENGGQGGISVDGSKDYFMGSLSAPNFLLVFSRYNCEYCKYFSNVALDSVNNEFVKTGQLRVAFKNLVEPTDTIAVLMAKLAEVARQTNHFEELHKIFFKADAPSDSVSIVKLALQSGIIAKDIEQRLNSAATIKKVADDCNAAKALNISATPSFVLNGQVHPGYMTCSDIRKQLATVKPAARQ